MLQGGRGVAQHAAAPRAGRRDVHRRRRRRGLLQYLGVSRPSAPSQRCVPGVLDERRGQAGRSPHPQGLYCPAVPRRSLARAVTDRLSVCLGTAMKGNASILSQGRCGECTPLFFKMKCLRPTWFQFQLSFDILVYCILNSRHRQFSLTAVNRGITKSPPVLSGLPHLSRHCPGQQGDSLCHYLKRRSYKQVLKLCILPAR